MVRILGITVLLVVFVAAISHAGNENVKVALHVQAHNATQTCDNLPQIEGCSDIVTTYPGCDDVDVFAVFFDMEEFHATEHGLLWPTEWGTGVTSHCGDLFIGDIVVPGDWMALSWFDCQPSSVGVVAWTWLVASSPGAIDPIPRPGGILGVTDCLHGVYREWPVICAMGAGVCGIYGDDPCGPSAAEPSTWGSIKAMFR